MATKRTRASAPPGADDFTLIRRVGPALAQRLYAAGVTTFAHLAALEPDDILARLDGHPGLSAARIMEEDWAGQARALLARAAGEVVEESRGALGVSPAGPTATGAPQSTPVAADLPPGKVVGPARQATFAVTLMLDADGNVARTRVRYTPVDGGKEEQDGWLRWDTDRLLRLIERHGRLKLPRRPADPPRPPSAALGDTAGEAHPVTPDYPPPQLRSVELVSPSATIPQPVVSRDEAHEARLEIDLSDLVAAGVQTDHYQVRIGARRIGDGACLTIGEARGQVGGASHLCVTTGVQTPPTGLYRLEIDLTLGSAPDAAPSTYTANMPGRLVYVC